MIDFRGSRELVSGAEHTMGQWVKWVNKCEWQWVLGSRVSAVKHLTHD